MMRYRLLATIILSILLTACSKYGIKSGTPDCVRSKIMDYSANATCNDPQVKEYIFQERTVYVFEPGTCGADMTSDVYDSDCKLLGRLGGFVGNTKINGESFSDAKLIRTIWRQ